MSQHHHTLRSDSTRYHPSDPEEERGCSEGLILQMLKERMQRKASWRMPGKHLQENRYKMLCQDVEKSASWQILTRKVNRFTATFTNFVKSACEGLNRGTKSTMMILVWMYSGIVPENIEVRKMEEKGDLLWLEFLISSDLMARLHG